MKIKDLIKKLQQYDLELDVILSSDEEGNTFNTVCEIASGFVDTKDEKEYKVGSVIHTENIYSEEEAQEQDLLVKQVLVIYPYYL